MLTKAHPNSLWQGTEQKVTECAAAKFRRFKKVLWCLPWMWLKSGMPWKSGWLIHCCFRGRVIKAFCTYYFNGHMLQLTIHKPTALFQRAQGWKSSYHAPHVCNWRLQRSDFEWINARINSECISFPSKSATLIVRPLVFYQIKLNHCIQTLSEAGGTGN